MEACERFYVEGLGLPVLSRFAGHAGYDGLILGLPNHRTQVELTAHVDGSPCPAPTRDNLLVLYLERAPRSPRSPTASPPSATPAVPPENPWWARDVTVERIPTAGASCSCSPTGRR